MEDDKPMSLNSIEKLNESNYRSWSVVMESILDERPVFTIVDGSESAPKPPAEPEGAVTDTTAQTAYATSLEAFNARKRKASTILLTSISSRLITYVDMYKKDPAKMWEILKDKYMPTTNMTRMQVLREYQALKMEEGSDMEAYLRKFQLAKRKVEEHGIKLEPIVHKSTLLSSISDTYHITAALIEIDEKINTNAAINRFLEEY